MRLTVYDRRPLTSEEPEAPVTHRHWRRWQQDEEHYLATRYGSLPAEQIAHRLGRSVCAVHDKARRLGLHQPQTPQDERERRREALQWAVEYQGGQSALAKRLGVSSSFLHLCVHGRRSVPSRVMRQIEQLGGDA